MAEYANQLLPVEQAASDDIESPVPPEEIPTGIVPSSNDLRSALKISRNTFRAVWIFLLFAAILAIAGIVLLVSYGSQPEYLTYSGWRIIHPGKATEWRICKLDFKDESYKSVSLKDVRIVASPPVPDDFDLGTDSCIHPWSSNSSEDAYIGVVFPRNIDIRRISIGHPTEVISCSPNVYDMCFSGCVSPTMCDDCCLKDETNFLPGKLTVQRLAGSDQWAETNHNSYSTESIGTYAGLPPSNPAKIAVLISGICCVSFAAVFFLAAPIQLYVACQLKKRLRGTLDELEQGTALVLSYGMHQWQAFVENEWGPGGREEKANSLLTYCIALPFCAGFAVLLLYYKTNAKHEGLSWALCAAIGVPLAFLFTIAVYPMVQCNRKRNYRILKDDPQKAVLASSTLTFGKVLLFRSDPSKKILVTRVLEGNETEGALLSVVYQVKQGKTKTKKVLRLPLPSEQLQEVKAFVTQHGLFYNPDASWMSEAMRAGRMAMRGGRLAHALMG